ncbi:centromere kinetochore component CENP-T-domain-containing protein [Exophiala viscosa]|uniref:centromere kinetochore component CENP-T-domain-containing protein n=1 Tax=Exophiala viscosa TaxID=2486360 RepID=UPI002190444B|nr:centromere kinetochore component CENP-T-domain-containing protein [Exophiala viscosa]
MSTTRPPLRDLQNTKTPTRQEPSTPHAIRALQQRSGANTRTIRKRRAYSDTVRRDSARDILRQLAKITAPLTRKTIRTPATARGKENQDPLRNGTLNDEAEGRAYKRPRLVIEGDDSFEDVSPPYYEEQEDDDSELPVAPTPSQLDDPTITFRSIDFAATARSDSHRTNQRQSFLAHDHESVDEQDDEPTILTELGRRAISEEPTGRLSRYSFGSIRMSDFGSELEVRRESDFLQRQTQKISPGDRVPQYDYEPLDFGGETEHLEALRKSLSPIPADESVLSMSPVDVSFQLEFAEQGAAFSHALAGRPEIVQHSAPVEVSELAHDESLVNMTAALETSPERDPTLELGQAGTTSQRRPKKLKMTRHGTRVPSLPRSLIKRVAIDAQARLGNRKPRLGQEHMQALEQATEWFFEQIGEDLEVYSNHARRKKRIDRSDVHMLMRRQRVLQNDGELQKAARELLPDEVLADFDEDEV